jgi:hypothetical protein
MIRDLGDGLVLRRASAADAERLAAFNADVLRHQDAPEPAPGIGAWTRDLMEGRNPAFRPEDATIVEDTRTGAIASSMMLMAQRWTYGGVEIAVGQPELVGTAAPYRGRGLVRAQFDVVHGWSAARGDLVQAISGVPWFYRQFGYEMALALGGVRHYVPAAMGPPDPERAAAWRVRPAALSDLAFIATVYRRSTARYAIATPVDEAGWRHMLVGRRPESAQHIAFAVIEGRDGRPAGFVGHRNQFWGRSLPVVFFEVAAGVAWRTVWPSVLAHLETAGRDMAAKRGRDAFGAIGFWLGSHHPAYEVFGLAQVVRPYAWYVRVPDLARLLGVLGPALDARLAASPLAGHGGELSLSFYRGGVRLSFEDGRLARAEAWQPPIDLVGQEERSPTAAPRGAAMFPGLTFSQLLFGFRSLDELQHAFPDVVVRSQETRGLLDALFPKVASDAWTVV